MISHFNLSCSDNSLYFEISAIQQDSGGLKITGIVGDGSAEAWFEACVAVQLQVCVLPIWEGGSDSLCQRYDQGAIEQGLIGCLEDVSFRTEKTFDPDTGCWQEKIVAIAKPATPSLWSMPRIERLYLRVGEKGPIWQGQVSS